MGVIGRLGGADSGYKRGDEGEAGCLKKRETHYLDIKSHECIWTCFKDVMIRFQQGVLLLRKVYYWSDMLDLKTITHFNQYLDVQKKNK